ncbi:MAG: AAA family ATPase [Nitrospirota bacterium]|jgi:chromosome partitioning protein
MHVQAVVNQKGGCGKTTTAIHVAAFFAREGRRALLVDLDPQGHATLGLGLAPAYGEGAYEVLVGTHDLGEVVVDGPVPGLSVVPASISLAAVEQRLAGRDGREAHLRQALLRLAPQLQFNEVILDCPPSLGLLTFNALWASDRVLVPIDPSVFSLDGLQRLCETITLVEASSGRTIRRDAVLTMFDRRTKFGRGLETAATDALPGDAALLRSRIRSCTRLREAALRGVPVTEFDPHCNGYWDYRRLTDELVDRRGDNATPPSAGVCDAVATEAANGEVEMTAQTGGPMVEPPSPSRVPAWGEAEPLDFDPPSGMTGTYGPIPIEGGVIVRFRDPGAREVMIAGTFNDWQPDDKVLSHREADGTWQKIVLLAPGSYEYRLVVDGDWEADPNNEAQVSNEFGGVNSVIHV